MGKKNEAIKVFRSRRVDKSPDEVKIAVISRSDFGRDGFRSGFFDLAYKVAALEAVDFIVFAGGLVSWPKLRQDRKKRIDALVARAKQDAKMADKKFDRIKAKKEATDIVNQQYADELTASIPRLKTASGRKNVKLYVISSSAGSFDGLVGGDIARRVARNRRDVLYWGNDSASFDLKQVHQVMGVICPRRYAWRSKYYSTMVDRLVEDELKSGVGRPPSFWVVGCSASSIMRPKGEAPQPIFSVPALHVLEDVLSSENAIGMRIIHCHKDGGCKITTYSFKDLASGERKYIPCPFKVESDEKKVVDSMKKVETTTPPTIGMLAERTGISRKRIRNAIRVINARNDVPSILYDDASGSFSFNPKWMQKHLSFPNPIPKEEMHSESRVVFGCLHAGSRFTDYGFLRGGLADTILEWDAEVLVAAGDLIEGNHHYLVIRGEAMGGLNISEQERIAAATLSHNVLKVFRKRFADLLENVKSPDNDMLKSLIHEALITVLYIVGNHDAWVENDGITPLEKFRGMLIGKLIAGIEQELEELGLYVYHLRNIVKSHVVLVSQENGEAYEMPSGLRLSIIHPRMGRTKTTSIRSEEALARCRGSQEVDLANFHVSTVVEHWEYGLGNRIATQAGTLKSQTSFENGKMKVVDFGVICIRTFSRKQRILVTEVMFVDRRSGMEPLSNHNLANNVIEFIEEKDDYLALAK